MTPCGATGSASSACQHDDRTGGRNPYFQMQAPKVGALPPGEPP